MPTEWASGSFGVVIEAMPVAELYGVRVRKNEPILAQSHIVLDVHGMRSQMVDNASNNNT